MNKLQYLPTVLYSPVFTSKPFLNLITKASSKQELDEDDDENLPSYSSH